MAKKIELDEIKRRLESRHDMKSDELDTLFNQSEEEIRKFYKQVLKAKSVKLLSDDADGEGKVAEDTYELPADKKAKLELAGKAQNEKAKKKFEAGAADLSHLPAAEQVTHEEAQEALRLLMEDEDKE